MLQKGLVQVYTTESEEMNFAPVGLGLRAAGQGLRTLIACFSPYGFMEGAGTASSLLYPHLSFDHSAFEQTPPGEMGEAGDPDKILETYQRSAEVALRGDYDVVILNGIHQVVNRGLLSPGDVLKVMKEKPGNVELVLSGRGAREEIMENSDLVTEMLVHVAGKMPDQTLGLETASPIEVITGDAKGKTTYCLGKAMLMSCAGIRSLILQFIKSPKPLGESKAIEKLPDVEIRAMGEGLFSERPSGSDNRHLEAAREAWGTSLAEILQLRYGLIVLDEINIATYYGLTDAEAVRDALSLKPRDLHLILSGRKAHFEVRERASVVIEMEEIKHPFKKGIRARRGIEF
jgi:cob(I)alamin adenosyltransferase